jgi:hypothetical protein
MLRRWHRRAYDIGLLLGILDLVLESLALESKVKGMGGKPRRTETLGPQGSGYSSSHLRTARSSKRSAWT